LGTILKTRFLLAAALIIAAPTVAAAQESSHEGAVLTYAPGFFESYNPVTALDMVQQVPGFGIDNGQHVRGLADTFANVLIDGERQSTKSESIQAILQRIPTASVERVELIREAIPGIDMRGERQVVNIILAAGGESATTVEAGIDYFNGSDVFTPSLNISRSWEFGRTRLTLGGQFSQNAAPLLRDERLEDASGALVETRSERTSRFRTQPQINASLNTRFDDESRLSLSFTGSTVDSRTNDRSLVDDAAGSPLRVQLFTATGDETSWEGTATYERPFSDTLSGQIVALNRDDTYSSDEAFLNAPYGGGRSTTYFDSTVDSGERALRGTLSWEPNDRHSLEIGAESAFNYLDSGLGIMRDTGSGPVAVPLPVANTRVEERRSEVFASHVWRPREGVTLESGLRFERSTIEQSGDASRERSFDNPKPSVALTWTSGERTQWRFAVERDVSQLSFGQFASEVDATDSQILLGNPELEPTKTWRASARWERRWGEDGSLSVSLTHEEVEGVNDLQPVTVVVDDTTVPVTTTTFDAPGNIGDGSRTYVFVNGDFPLDGMGLSDARLDLSLMLRDSSVTDPTTGRDRRFQGNEDWRIHGNFRQNLPERDLAWGFGFYTQGDEDVHRFDEVMVFTTKTPQMDVFVETTAIDDMTIRLTVGDFLPSVRERERTFYDGSRALGLVDSREIQEQDLGGFVSLTARRTF
jgi:hypothetical protein